MSTRLEISHADPITAEGVVGPDGHHVDAVRALFARVGGQGANERLVGDLAEISGLPADFFLDANSNATNDPGVYPERIPSEEPPFSLPRPYLRFHMADDEAARQQVVADARAPAPPKQIIPKRPPEPIHVLAGTTAADRIRELKALQALRGTPETFSGIDVMERFQAAVSGEIPLILESMAYEGHAFGEAREEIGAFQALAKIVVRKMVNREGLRIREETTTPAETVPEQQVASRGMWRAVTSRLKQLVVRS